MMAEATENTGGHGSNLARHAVSGVVLAGVALAALAAGGWAWNALVAVVIVGLAYEWTALVRIDAALAMGTAIAAIGLAAGGVALAIHPLAAVACILVVAMLLMIFATVRLDRNSFWSGLGLIYVGLPSIALLWLRGLPAPLGLIVTLWLLLVVWATDIFAYFVGRSVGGPKLIPTISPNKTWSGFFGGIVAAGLVGAGMHFGFGLAGTVVELVAASVAVSLVSQIGDAVESALKRSLGVKDSGTLIPGHGGLFDRLDGLLFAAPFAALAVTYPIIVVGAVP